MKFSPVSFLEWYATISLKQRYLNATLLFSLIVISVAFYGWRYVDQVSHRQLVHIEDRADASGAMQDAIDQIHAIETAFQVFVNKPDKKNEQSISHLLRLFGSSIERLRSNKWIKQDSSLTGLVISLGKDKIKLADASIKLINVRKDGVRWIPAMYIVQTRMLEHNVLFVTELDFNIAEVSEALDTKNKIRVYKLLNELRHSWDMMIGEFRLMLSIKFGAFTDDQELGINSRKENVAIYMDRIDGLLVDLGAMGRRDLVDDFSVVEMRRLFYIWSDTYNSVLTSLSSENWRNDTVVFHNEVQPVLNQIHQRASSLQLELSVATAKNITNLSTLARDLSNFVIILAISIALASMLGYFIFQRSIIRPIHQFGLALQSEAIGKYRTTNKYMISKAEEFRDLMKAFDDMREQVRTRQSHLDHMAHHDSLTLLPNRVLLRDRLGLAISRSQRNNTDVGLMFLDLDQFKQINDSLGHGVGDQLLKQVATRLQECTRDTDTVSRLGGDEFAILIEGVTDVDQMSKMARKILKAFSIPFTIGNHELHSTTSIGIAMGPSDDITVDALIKDADIAMYHAKDLGRGNYKFYSGEMAAYVAEHMVMENQLRHALEENEFFLVFQPVVDMKTNQIVSTEALLRWNHPHKGVLEPGKFLSIVEETGLIRPITQWVLTQASHQYNEYKKAGFENVRMAVNLSGSILKNNSVLDVVINAVAQTQIDPNSLIIEITEDTLLEDMQGAEKSLAILKEMGMHIALDDFGTGQSSLSHLRMGSIDIVKIDRSFIRDIPGEKNDMNLVDAIIAMSHKLQMKVVAEGVETQEQIDFLRWHKCDAIQGYYFSKPVVGSEIIKLLLKDKMRASG